jgi:hypothetical protein
VLAISIRQSDGEAGRRVVGIIRIGTPAFIEPTVFKVSQQGGRQAGNVLLPEFLRRGKLSAEALAA